MDPKLALLSLLIAAIIGLSHLGRDSLADIIRRRSSRARRGLPES
jgi:hypothetical protein